MTGPDTEILSRLVATLESARARKPMYFSPVEPRAAESWLNGLRTGCSLAGLEWSSAHRRPALVRRGLEETAAWETAHLADPGLGPEAIVDELLAIEVEMWRDMGRQDA